MSYPVEINGVEYHPIPASWIEHPRATDHKANLKGDPLRLYAVSAGVRGGHVVRTRYMPVSTTGVLTLNHGACEADDLEGYVPCGLTTNGGWHRSYVPSQYQDPEDIGRACEREHLVDLWDDELGIREDGRRILADNGPSQIKLTNARAGGAE